MPLARAYLDHNATTPLRPEAAAAVARALELGGNPSSVHRAGRAARKLLEEARAQVAALLNVAPDAVIFTGGGTEANHLALAQAEASGARTLMYAAIEHPSLLAAAEAARVPHKAVLPCGGDGCVDVAAARDAIARAEAPIFLSLMRANNETGVLQPVAELARLVHEKGGLVHCDAVQAVGKIPVGAAELGADFISLAAHKLGGPMGVGALVVAGDAPVAAMLRGGSQEMGRRAGTENLSGIAGFGAAAEIAARETPAFERLAVWRDAAERRIRDAAPDAVFFGAGSARLANTSCFAAPGLKAETLVMALDLAGVEVSAGSACSSGKVTRSHVLDAMDVDDNLARAAIRVSLGWSTQETHIDRLVEAWLGARRRVDRVPGGAVRHEAPAPVRATGS